MAGVTKESARYVKIVEWSEVDNCYVGSLAKAQDVNAKIEAWFARHADDKGK